VRRSVVLVDQDDNENTVVNENHRRRRRRQLNLLRCRSTEAKAQQRLAIARSYVITKVHVVIRTEQAAHKLWRSAGSTAIL